MRVSLTADPDELAVFDEEFDRFFPPAQLPATPSDPLPTLIVVDGPPQSDRGSPPTGLSGGPKRQAGDMESLAGADLAGLTPGEAEAARREAARLARRLARRLTRRRKSTQPEALDFRRTLRRALNSGGEPLALCWRSPRPRPVRLVLVADVSGSMDPYTRFLLTFMAALARDLPRAEAFVFSTRLTRITPWLRSGSTGNRLDNIELPLSGGTNIGGCLAELARRYRSIPSGRRTTVLILSDGWDRGSPEDLIWALAELSRLAGRIIWLNPLAADPDFVPLTRALVAAQPYLAALLPFSRLVDIANLAPWLEPTKPSAT